MFFRNNHLKGNQITFKYFGTSGDIRDLSLAAPKEGQSNRGKCVAKGYLRLPPLSSRHERQPLEQMHVLFVLEQRAVQRRDQLLGIALA
jgi:hypothetical protein